MKQDEYRKGSIWQSQKDGKWYAEIQYLGKRYKTKGVKSKETAALWLERKRKAINDVILEKRKRISEIIDSSWRH